MKPQLIHSLVLAAWILATSVSRLVLVVLHSDMQTTGSAFKWKEKPSRESRGEKPNEVASLLHVALAKIISGRLLFATAAESPLPPWMMLTSGCAGLRWGFVAIEKKQLLNAGSDCVYLPKLSFTVCVCTLLEWLASTAGFQDLLVTIVCYHVSTLALLSRSLSLCKW